MGQKSKILGYLEGTSTLALMGIAMPLKYIGDNEILVKILGPIHGLLFMLYLGVLFFGVGKFWTRDAFAIGFFAAVLPGGPFWFENKLSQGKWSIETIEPVE